MRITFPEFSGLRCLMMPYIQGDLSSVPEMLSPYKGIVESVFVKKGDIGFLTIDEATVKRGSPHRGMRAKYPRALHTEAGVVHNIYCWGKPTWGGSVNVVLDRDVKILLANNMDDTCAVWDSEQEDTSDDGDIGSLAYNYPYGSATFMKAGEVWELGIFTPHESLTVRQDCRRQFLRIVSSGVHGREEYFTPNPLLNWQ